jgi:hypothetical protein
MARKAQFTRPEPGFSMYEGRTRGKRMKYTYSEDEDDFTSDGPDIRRSTRGLAIPTGPTITSSGRQVRTRFGQLYGSTGENTTARESPASDAFERSDGSDNQRAGNGRSTRSGVADDHWASGRSHIAGYNEVDEMDDEDDAISSGEEWQGEDEMDDQLDDDISEATDEGLEPRSLIVKLRYKKPTLSEQPFPETPQKAAQPDLAFRPTPTTSNFTPKVQDTKPMQLDSPPPPATALSPANGYSNGRELSADAGSIDHQPQPTLLSFSKFLYNPTPQTSASDVSSSPQTAPPNLPTPPTTAQPPQSLPNQHNQGW